jgi:hypothetical protein
MKKKKKKKPKLRNAFTILAKNRKAGVIKPKKDKRKKKWSPKEEE